MHTEIYIQIHTYIQHIHILTQAAYTGLAAAFVITFSSSWGGLNFALMAELFGMHARAPGVGMSMAVNWLINLVISYVLFETTQTVDMDNIHNEREIDRVSD